jgi:hypothetical protein
MNRASRQILLLLLLALFLCAGVPDVQAFEPILFGEEGAFLKIDFQGQLYGVVRDTGSGPDNSSDTTDLFFRRNRLTFWGHGKEKYGFILQIEYAGERSVGDLYVSDEPGKDFYVLDAYLMADFSNSLRLYAGKQKIQLTRENNEDCFEPLSLDRSLFIYTPFKHSRDTGIVLWGNIPDVKMQYRLGVSEGKESGDSPKSSLMYTGRLHVSLLEPEYALGYKGTYLGTKKVLTFGAGVQYEPDAVYSNTIAKTGAKDYFAWTIDGFLEYPTSSGTFTLSAAYLETDFDSAYKGSNPDTDSIGIDGEKKGWYAKAGYLLPSKVGPGQVQPFIRYEDWKFAKINDVFDQKIRWIGAGINYLIKGQNLRVTLEYSMTDFDKESNSQSMDFNTLSAMLQFRF